jgi:glycosyltransferase involved in cell wall biosynthesis
VLDGADEVQLRMVGGFDDVLDDDWGRDLVREAVGLGIVHRQRVDTFRELRDWDIFVLPSRRDPCPLSVLEAMASGLPVVGTRTDGIAEQVTPETGLLVAPESPDELARAILAMVADAPARAAMGAAGRRRVSEVFSVERQAGGLDDAYRRALARPPSRDRSRVEE